MNDLEKKFLEHYLGVSGTLPDLWSAFYLAGLAGTASSVSITGGAIDGTTIGATTPSTVVATTIKTSGYTVATLPAGTVGMRAYVTDATTPTYNAALVGGGAVVVPVFHNGTAWVSA